MRTGKKPRRCVRQDSRGGCRFVSIAVQLLSEICRHVKLGGVPFHGNLQARGKVPPDFLQTLYFMGAGNFSQAGDDLFEMFEVGDVEHDFHAGLAVGGAGGDVADVAFGVADHAGNTLQHSETIVAEDGEFYGIGGGSGFVARPSHFNFSLGLVKKIGDVRTVDGVDGNSFAARDVADDAFATDGVTTARAVDQHIALAFDGDGVLIA